MPVAKKERNDDIFSLAEIGIPRPAIAARHGITRERVRQIVMRMARQQRRAAEASERRQGTEGTE